MRFRRLTAVAGMATVVAVAAGVLVNAPMASASGAACNPGCSAYVEFASYGEHFTLHDYDADGHAVAGYLQAWDADGWYGLWYLENHNGYAGPPVVKNVSIPEGMSVRYQACLVHVGGAYDCSSWRYDTA